MRRRNVDATTVFMNGGGTDLGMNGVCDVNGRLRWKSGLGGTDENGKESWRMASVIVTNASSGTFDLEVG